MPHGPNWEKAPADLAERFTATVSAMPGAQVRKMFGYPAGFVNGQMFTGIFASDWFVRLPDAERDELAAAGGTPFAPMPGRPMREYLVLPPDTAARSSGRRAVGRSRAGVRGAAAAEEEALGQEVAHQRDQAVGRLELDRMPRRRRSARIARSG